MSRNPIGPISNQIPPPSKLVPKNSIPGISIMFARYMHMQLDRA